MPRYALRAFGGPVRLPDATPATTPPPNIVVHVRQGNVAVKAREGDK